MAVLVALAAPNLTNTSARTQLLSARDALSSSLQRARTEALLRGVTTIMCPGTAETRCQTNAVWSDGWVILLADDGSDPEDSDPAGVLLHREYGLGPGLRITSTVTSARPIVFGHFGNALGRTFTLCTTRASAADAIPGWKVVLQPGGHMHTEPVPAAACV